MADYADSLFAECVIPGCRTPVVITGDPCQGCIDAFGPALVHTPGGHRMTAEEIAERDGSTRRIYEQRAAMRRRGADPL